MGNCCDSKYHKGELIEEGGSVYKIIGFYHDAYWHYRVKWLGGDPRSRNVCGIPLTIESKIRPFTHNIRYDKNNFEPFHNVLVRNHDKEIWAVSLFSHIERYQMRFHCMNGEFLQCVPYEGNEYLLGTTDDCFEYYKSWEL